MFAIEIKNLTKRFDKLTAVDKVTLGVNEGELFGLLGPNGAGKTTLIKMLATLLHSSSGSAKIWGHDVDTEQDDVRRSIGMVFQETALDLRLTGRENLDFHTRMYGMKKEVRDKRIKEVLELVELKDKADDLAENYSGGMKRRLEIARGLMHYPKVLFLDEPTLGLDPQTRRHIWDYIRSLNEKEKVTIILTTHYMEEADYLCDRVAIIDHGKIIALDEPSNLKKAVAEDIISLEVKNKKLKDLKKILEKEDFVKDIKIHNSHLDLSVEASEKKVPIIINCARDLGIEIDSVSMRKPTLEDVFLHYVGTTMREREADAKERMKSMMGMRMRRGR